MSQVKKHPKSKKIEDKLVCEYCGKTKDEIVFCIGASKSSDPQWTMVEGTGKMSCPDCYPKAMLEGQKAIDNYVKAYNQKK